MPDGRYVWVGIRHVLWARLPTNMGFRSISYLLITQLMAHGLGLAFKPGQGILGVDMHINDYPAVGCEHAVITWKVRKWKKKKKKKKKE